MRFSLVVAGLLVHCVVLAQTSRQSQKFDVHQANKSNPRNYWVFDQANAPKQQGSDTLRLIIRLKGDPLSTSGRQRTNNIREQHDQFKADLNRLSGNAGNGRTSSLNPT